MFRRDYRSGDGAPGTDKPGNGIDGPGATGTGTATGTPGQEPQLGQEQR